MLVGPFNQDKVLIWAFSVIVKTLPIVGYNFSIYLARCDVDISCTGSVLLSAAISSQAPAGSRQADKQRQVAGGLCEHYTEESREEEQHTPGH